MYSSKLQRGALLRRKLPQYFGYLRKPGLLLSVLIITSLALYPYGADGAPAASRQPTGSGPSAMPTVAGADFTLTSSMFQSDKKESKEGSLKDNLTIPA